MEIVENARQQIAKENQFNDPPEAGKRFYMVSVEVAYPAGSDSRRVSESDFILIGSSRVVYDQFEHTCGVVPDELDGEIYGGGRIQGNICFEIPEDESGLVLGYQPDYGIESRRFLSLTHGKPGGVALTTGEVLTGDKGPELGDMRIGSNGNPGTLDPAKNQLGFSTTTLHDFVHNRLVARDVTLADPQADLAESWIRSSDGRRYVFTLRDDVEFHTGRKFDSADLKANWDRVLYDVGDKGRGLGLLSEVSSYGATGEYEWTVTIRGDSPVFLPNQTHWAFGVADEEGFGEIEYKAVGTGPYTFEDYIPDDRLVMAKFIDYYDQDLLDIRPDRIIMSPITEATTRIAALKTGEVDFIFHLGLNNAQEIEDAPGIYVVKQAAGTASYSTIVFNLHQPHSRHDFVADPEKTGPMADVRVRRAIAHALDLDAINKTAFFGYGDTNCNIIPEGHWAYEPLDCPQRDIEKAKALLAEAGYPNGFEVRFMPEGARETKAVANLTREQLKDIGINVEIVIVESWGKEVWQDGFFDLATASYLREPDPDGLMQSVFRSNPAGDPPTWGGNNVMGYHDPQVEVWFDQGRSTSDQAVRKVLYNNIVQKVLIDDVALIKSSSRPRSNAASDKVVGATNLPAGHWHTLGACPRIRSWRRKPPRNNLLTAIWTLAWSK